jgi:hypothetical protein
MKNNRNNILIARFMGMKPHHQDSSYMVRHNGHGSQRDIVPVAELDYDTDWNSLMDVVEEIEATLDSDGYGHNVEVSNTLCVIRNGNYGGEVINGQEGLTKRDAVHSAVVEFIKAHTL